MNRRAFLLGVAGAVVVPSIARSQPNVGALDALVATVPGAIGVYVRLMDGSPPIYTHRADEAFPSASVIKVLIMATAYRHAALRRSLLDHTAVIHRYDRVGGSETFGDAPIGSRYRVRELLGPMIRQSDNTAANALISYFGFDEINATATALGMTKTHLKRHFLDYAAIVRHNENVTTPADMGRLLYAIERGAREAIPTVASPVACREMIGLMLGQEDRDKIPRGIPSGVPIANKTGEITGVRSDVAIVDPYGETPYVIAVLTKNLSDYAGGIAAINRISRDVFTTLHG